MTSDEKSEHPQSRNPAPRPALRTTKGTGGNGVSVLRPGLSSVSPGTPDSAAARTSESAGPDLSARRKGKPKEGRDDRHADEAGHGKGGKNKKKSKSHKASTAKELVVALPKPVRKALADAATRHGTTPERLAALVLSEWLDH